EGASRQISINSYERNPRVRKVCIDHYGCTCFVCGFDFGERYGAIGNGFIHVHHLVPISDISKEYSVNPIEDLRPVCPNCHAMLHKTSSTLSIEELQTRIR
ncbi:MAG: HNH endonuclease, partial [Acidobacteriota bacterium]|nr:HNH endonuclease [Acidobacteriota bacterium]